MQSLLPPPLKVVKDGKKTYTICEDVAGVDSSDSEEETDASSDMDSAQHDRNTCNEWPKLGDLDANFRMDAAFFAALDAAAVKWGKEESSLCVYLPQLHLNGHYFCRNCETKVKDLAKQVTSNDETDETGFLWKCSDECCESQSIKD
jgi:hypothetical protein